LMREGNRFLLIPSDITQPIIGLDNIKHAAKVIWHRKPLL
jgi:hypothetical protein